MCLPVGATVPIRFCWCALDSCKQVVGVVCCACTLLRLCCNACVLLSCMIRAPCQSEAHILPADLLARVEVMCHHNVCANTATHVGRLKRCVPPACVSTHVSAALLWCFLIQTWGTPDASSSILTVADQCTMCVCRALVVDVPYHLHTWYGHGSTCCL